MSNTEALIFENPPTSMQGRRGGEWASRLAPLRERPGDWARLPGTYNATTVTMIKAGKYQGIERGEFDAVGRKADGGKQLIWVRYIGHLRASGEAVA